MVSKNALTFAIALHAFFIDFFAIPFVIRIGTVATGCSPKLFQEGTSIYISHKRLKMVAHNLIDGSANLAGALSCSLKQALIEGQCEIRIHRLSVHVSCVILRQAAFGKKCSVLIPTMLQLVRTRSLME